MICSEAPADHDHSTLALIIAPSTKLLSNAPGHPPVVRFVVYAVAAGTYAFYSFNVIMYGAILSLGVAVLYFYLVVRNCQTNRRDATTQIAFLSGVQVLGSGERFGNCE